MHAKKLYLPLNHIGKPAVRGQHALGLARGAGCVNEVGPLGGQGGLWQGNYGRLPVGKIVQNDGKACPGIFHNIGQTVGRGLGINGQVNRTQPLNAQHHLWQIGRAACFHSHNVAPPNTLRRQPCCATQGIFAQLRVGQGIAPLVLNRGTRAKLMRSGIKQFWQRANIVLSDRAVAPLGQLLLFFIQQIVELGRFCACRQLGNHAFNPRHKALHISVAQVVAAVAHGERKTTSAQLLHNQRAEKNGFLGAVALFCLHNGKFCRAGGRIGQKIDKCIRQKGKIAPFKFACRQLVRCAHMAVKRGILSTYGL